MNNLYSTHPLDFSDCMFRKRAYIPALQLASMIRHRAYYLYDHLVNWRSLGKLNRQDIDHITTEVRILFNEALRRDLLPEIKTFIISEVDMCHYVRTLLLNEYVGVQCTETAINKWRNGTAAVNNLKVIYPELFDISEHKQVRRRRPVHVRCPDTN